MAKTPSKPDKSGDPPRHEVEMIDLKSALEERYLAYALSTIMHRALPDVRDGLKPVHRRLLYAMYDGGYRPDRGYNKCSRVVGDVMGQYHPHGDSAIYDALVRLVQPWSLRYPLVDGQGNFGSPGNDGAAAPRYTECRMAQLSMEMVRDIEQDTVDKKPNYDGKTEEPVVLPARFPNLLVNGSSGIAVGMATNIPPHNLREVASGAQWYLSNPTAGREELLAQLMTMVKGPDFPTGALIMGRKGIEDAYRTGRGSIIMRAAVAVEEIQNRVCLVVTELPYQVNPDMLAQKIAEHVKRGVSEAGGFPVEMPAISLSEPFQKPTTMLYRNMLAMEAEGLELIAIYHSHPDGPARPSATDVANAYYPDTVQLIISLADRARPSVRTFTIIDGVVAEVEWEEESTDYTH